MEFIYGIRDYHKKKKVSVHVESSVFRRLHSTNLRRESEKEKYMEI